MYATYEASVLKMAMKLNDIDVPLAGRMRTLTEKGAERYQKTVDGYTSKLTELHKD